MSPHDSHPLSEPGSDAEARAKLHLPASFEIPETHVLEDDLRATLLHTLHLHKAFAETGIVCSPIWEGHAGEAAVRAAVVPAEVVRLHYEGPGVRALADGEVVSMVADIVGMLLADPVGALKALGPTAQLWSSADAPVRTLETPYKPHLGVLTLVVADFNRKVGAGFTELEWIASLGLIDAFYDPAIDPPGEQVLVAMRAKTLAMCAAEEDWMRALQAAG